MEWKPIEKFDRDQLNDELILHHHAVQFIAMAGKYLLPEKNDDSHTNMMWSDVLNSYIGRELPQYRRVGVRLPDLSLCIYDDKDYIMQALEMNGYTKDELFEWLNKALQANAINTELLRDEMHYAVPHLEAFLLTTFNNPDPEIAKLTARIRSNAHHMLQKMVKPYHEASEVRIWPHHFDTGTFISFKDQKGAMTASIGLGLAIGDDMVEEPYFYVNHWIKNPADNYSSLKNPGQGKWILEDWKGAVLPLSEVAAMPENKQEKMVHAFLLEAVEQSKQLIG